MSVIANTFNTMYAGLDGLEKRTDRLYNSINQKYQFFTNSYTAVMDTYKDLKQEVKDTYDVVNNICKKAEKAYEQVKPAVDWSKKVFGSAFSKIKSFFYSSPTSKPGSIDDVVDNANKTKTQPTTAGNAGAASMHNVQYEQNKYNNEVATQLGARDKVIDDYVSGKSYKGIKQNFKNNANGMNISDSTIRRVMHKYEASTGQKYVGNRKASKAEQGTKDKGRSNSTSKDKGKGKSAK